MESGIKKDKGGRPRKDNVQMLLRVSPEFREELRAYFERSKDRGRINFKFNLSQFIVYILKDYMGTGKTIGESIRGMKYRHMDNSEFE